MNFQKFIYDFLKFNDFSANFHDISARAEALKSCAVGVWYKFEGKVAKRRGYRIGETSPQNRRSRIKQS